MSDSIHSQNMWFEITIINPPDGYSGCMVTGVNDSGIVIGKLIDEKDVLRTDSFIYSSHSGDFKILHACSLDAINDRNMIVGYVNSGSAIRPSGQPNTVFDRQAAVFDLNGDIRNLGLEGGSYASGINDAGDIVGSQVTRDSSGQNTTSPFYLSEGKQVMLDLPSGTAFASATCLNDNGLVGGYVKLRSTAKSGLVQSIPILWRRGMPQLLPTPKGYNGASVVGVSDKGDVLCNAKHSDARMLGKSRGALSVEDLARSVYFDAYVISGSSISILSAAQKGGGDYVHCLANAFSATGISVGSASLNVGKGYAYLYTNGRMIDLNTVLDNKSGWKLSVGRAISRNGHIAGNGFFENNYCSYLLTPM